MFACFNPVQLLRKHISPPILNCTNGDFQVCLSPPLTSFWLIIKGKVKSILWYTIRSRLAKDWSCHSFSSKAPSPEIICFIARVYLSYPWHFVLFPTLNNTCLVLLLHLICSSVHSQCFRTKMAPSQTLSFDFSPIVHLFFLKVTHATRFLYPLKIWNCHSLLITREQ